jgi:hypothetical protein
MSSAVAAAIHDEIAGQWSGYWLEPGRDVPSVCPAYRPTGGVLRRLGETDHADFVCLDLVLVESLNAGFLWLPLSEAGRYTYAHSAGLMRGEPGWRVAYWNGTVSVFGAEYTDSLGPREVAQFYGPEAFERARHDRPTVQLHLRRLPT